MPLTVLRAARILQLPSEPTDGLLGQGFAFRGHPILDQVDQSRREQLGRPAFAVGLQTMPITVSDARLLMELP